MAFQFHHRKLQQKTSPSGTAQPVKRHENLFPDYRCFKCGHTLPDLLPPPRPPPPMDSAHEQSNHHLHLSRVLIFFLSAFSIFSAFLIYLAFTIRHRSTRIRNISRSRNQEAFDDTYQDFVDENHGLGLFDHAIWLINTQGLEQSVIDSIAVFKYKKGEGLIEGTDCSVCLSEFQEDESLRLLPKCSHTFHVPCIDTWIRSHKNCHLCRVPIVCVANNVVVHTTASNQGSTEFGSGEDLRVVTSGELEILQTREDGTSANEGNFEIRVQSDLSNLGEEGEKKLKGIRRSISMDFSVVANIQEMESEGSSGAKLGQMKKHNSDSRIPSWGNRSLKTNRLIKSSSFNCTRKGHISKERSFLSRGKSFLPIYGKNKARTQSERCV